MGETWKRPNAHRLVETLYARLAPRLRGYFAKKGAPPQEHDDLLQETFKRLLARLNEGFLPREHVERWVFATARNIAVDLFRSATRQSQLACEIPTPSDEPAEMGDSLSLVHGAIGRLPQKLRDVFVLRHLEGLRNGEVSERLGISPGAVATRLCRARMALVATLDPTLLELL